VKRAKADTESLVYAYGCGQPIAGWSEAKAEAERCGMLWDRLVQIERMADAEVIAAAGGDVPRIVELDAIRRAERATKADGWKVRIRDAERELWPLLSAWRRDHHDELRAIEDRRRERVTEARHGTECWWPNYNAVIARYETARVETRKRGRNLRLRDIARDDGCLTVQIQRTRSGLGASPAELSDGSLSMLSIGIVPAAAYDPTAAFRGERDRMCRTVVEMRIDSAGNALRLPVWMHRPLPADCRIKSAQIVWQPRGTRMEYGLRLTISRPRVERASMAPPAASARVRIDIRDHGGGLHVAEVTSWPGEHVDRVMLDRRWCVGMDRVDRLPAVIANASLPDQQRIRARLELPGLRTRLLRRRREQYRLAARQIAMTHQRIVVETPALSEAAWLDRGTEASALRHRACAHVLVAEIQHQARKHGAACEVVLAERAASAPMPRRVRRRRINGLGDAATPESGALAKAAAAP
jgi:hypothetical protein